MRKFSSTSPSLVKLFCLLLGVLDRLEGLAGAISAPKTATVSFEPADGKLYVGSKDVIRCVVTDNPTQEAPGKFALTADPDNPSLLSLDNATAQIKPPAGSDVYKITGKTSVMCRWTGAADVSAEKTLSVQVLPATTTATIASTTNNGVAVQQSMLCAITVTGLLVVGVRTLWFPIGEKLKRA
ncbi:hypothetical protein CSKR_203582 [Clonorchis sinensis]|uniref:Ig-like domain-containing protein n=1 Tax=Clonorchis sinensis TaxID=79923 RepID=A0A8T1MCU9_CLOSI|nr:hypothetical protein CSKR_203582 [Clonorchis sinensis]